MGIGRFLAGKSSLVTTGGQGFVRYNLRPGELVMSEGLLAEGVYEVERTYKPCEHPDCGFQQISVRRVDMDYLTEKQRRQVKDISPRFRNPLGCVA